MYPGHSWADASYNSVEMPIWVARFWLKKTDLLSETGKFSSPLVGYWSEYLVCNVKGLYVNPIDNCTSKEFRKYTSHLILNFNRQNI